MAALSNGELLNFTQIASDAAVPSRTVQNYYRILEGTLLGYQLPSFRKTPTRQAVATAEIACRQQAKSFELRATMSLACLWQSQSKKAEAHQMLSIVYGWFTKGFDTKDLQEAKVLLQEVGSQEAGRQGGQKGIKRNTSAKKQGAGQSRERTQKTKEIPSRAH